VIEGSDTASVVMKVETKSSNRLGLRCNDESGTLVSCGGGVHESESSTMER